MKKVLTVFLLGSMLLFPVPTYAWSNDQGILKEISFDNIKDEVKTRNYDISVALDKIDDGRKMVANSVYGINEQIKNLSNNSQEIKNYFIEKPDTDGIHIEDNEIKNGEGTTIGRIILDSNNNEIWSLNTIEVPDPTTASMEAVIDYSNFNLLKLYQSQIMVSQGQVASLNSQQGNTWKSWIQRDMSADQMIWGAQQLYMSYNSLAQKDEELNMNRSLLQKRLTITKLQQQFGMATQKDLNSLEIQLRDLDIAIKSLKEGGESIKGSLNLMLGQAFDANLTIQDTPELDLAKINEMDYDTDQEKAITQSYNVMLQGSSTEDDIQSQKDKERLAFDKSYKEVKDKKQALDNERYKLKVEQENWDLVQLKYNLGMISQLELEIGQVTFKSQALKVTTAKEELLKAYTAYGWMVEGISFSS